MVIAKKKVKPQMNNTIKNMDYNWAPGPDPPNNQEAGVPRAIFIPHSNSLPFEERRVTLEQPVKIGRNVYRATPSPTNTIFECRVLSRHHATLYYDKGHFYLVDNQSSNGTFINNNRCSISKEQEPHEVFSGDVVQFGIPVVENAANSEKNTFPPVVALLKLYHPDGKEAKLSFNPTMTTPLHLKELYQLNNFVQEAIQREAALESRLRTMREWVERTRAEARSSWELFVGEQRLLMRVHTLESMHAMGKQPDAQQIAQLLNDKRNYQEVAQESLRAAHEQRLALEESLERRNREAAALHQHNCALRLAANNALAELQKLAARCERKMCAARLAIAAAEEREQAVRSQLPLAYSIQNGEAKMLVVSTDSNKALESRCGGSLEEAVRALPDYVKLLMPHHVLSKIGIKTVSTDLKSGNDVVILKNSYNKKQGSEEEGGSEASSGHDQPPPPPPPADDDKHNKLNHELGHEVESSSPLDGDLRPDNNANSTYSDPENTEDSPSKSGMEYANILRVMAGLNEEIKALRERLAASAAENEQLRTVRDELLAAHAETRDEQPAVDDVVDYRARIADLQAQLSRSNVAEEANLAEIQRLASSAAEMQAELAFRPTRADIDDLTAVVGKLRQEMLAKDQLIESLHARINKTRTADRAVATGGSLEDLREAALDKEPLPDDSIDAGKISAEIDEMFRLDYEDDDDESDSAATEIHRDDESDSVATELHRDDETSLATELPVTELVSERDKRAESVTESEHLEPGSESGEGAESLCESGEREEERVGGKEAERSAVLRLEEELVLAKERWAAVNAERALLAAQLAAQRSKVPPPARLAALLLPLAIAYAFYLLLPYIS